MSPGRALVYLSLRVLVGVAYLCELAWVCLPLDRHPAATAWALSESWYQATVWIGAPLLWVGLRLVITRSGRWPLVVGAALSWLWVLFVLQLGPSGWCATGLMNFVGGQLWIPLLNTALIAVPLRWAKPPKYPLEIRAV